jgi:triosephosphate isomerase
VNQIKDFVSYSLVGHSERKKYFNEQIENIETKIDFLLPFGIKPIVCAGSEQDLPGNIKKYNPQQIAIMFEPPSAISKNGVFEAVDPAKVEETISSWQNKYGPYQFLYGGSVNSENAKSLLLAGAEGFVSGKASLNVDSFIEILQNV